MTMDPLTLSIVSDVIANGVTTVFSHVYRRMTAEEKRVLHKRLEADKTFGEIIQKATATVAKELKTSTVSDASLRTFLVSPETETAIRRVYSFYLSNAGNNAGSDIDSVRAEFTAAMAFNLGVERADAERISCNIFDLLLAGVERALSFAAEQGSVGAHEALSSRRFSLVRDEIAAVHQSLDFLTKRQKAAFAEIQDFEGRLRAQVLARHSHIVPPHFDSLRKVPIDDLYVSPDLLTEPAGQDREGGSTALNSFLETTYRAVLLGDPGGGKSTLAQKVTHDLARHYSQRLLGGRLVTPIMVILREYGAYKKENRCSVLEYLEITAKSLYQLTPPAGSLEYLLLSGKLFVIFDGLDELLDTSYRQEVSLDIEVFCSLYSAVPALVTSRKVGYEQAPLDPSKFTVVYLAPFNQAQVEEYANKWFLVQADLFLEQRLKKVKSFIEESSVVPDLRANPLMLALMCNIYRGENYIPQNRPEVYEKCATMLFERWDRSRGIVVPLPFEAHIRPAMMHLAYWIYSNGELQSGVTEAALIDKAIEYLVHRRFDDVEEARRAAKEFIDFCRGRAWVFTDVGTTKEGNRIYQFTHRTFLEYFAGAHLARINETAESLGEALRARIAQREWDVVAQLAFQIKAKTSEGAADKLLGALVESSKSDDSTAGWSSLSFAARCLEFLVPSPSVTKTITETCLDLVIGWGLRHWKAEKADIVEIREGGVRLLGDLLSCSAENRRLVGKYLEDALLRRIDQSSEREVYLCLEMGMSLEIAEIRSREIGAAQDFVKAISRKIYTESKDKMVSFHPQYIILSTHLFYLGDLTLDDFIEAHGTEAIFHNPYLVMFPGSGRYGIAALLLRALAEPEVYKGFSQRVIPHLEYVGNFLSSRPVPWFARRVVVEGEAFFDNIFSRLEALPEAERIRLRGSAWFGLFVLLGSISELRAKSKLDYLGGRVNVEEMFVLLKMRGLGGSRKKLQRVFGELDLLPSQVALVQRWVAGEITFFDRPEGEVAEHFPAEPTA